MGMKTQLVFDVARLPRGHSASFSLVGVVQQIAGVDASWNKFPFHMVNFFELTQLVDRHAVHFVAVVSTRAKALTFAPPQQTCFLNAGAMLV